MKAIDYRAIEKIPITIEVMNMISKLHEYKGRQELYIETQPEILDKLMEVARIQSTEASNKIEGIYTSDKRLKEIVQKKSEPRNRNEKEIAGYREVLGTIIKAYKDFEERFVLLEKKKMTSPERVYSIIERSLVKLGKSDIMTLCPELSQKTVERALKKLVDEEKIAKIGAGKSTTYVDVKRL